MGFFEEPRYVIRNVCNHFYEMPENTIREQTFCCGSGSGLGTDENLEMRMRGGMPRGHAVKHVRDAHGVNVLACMCAIDKATLPAVVDYWVGGVEVCGVHELVGNALVMKGEKERTLDLRQEPLLKKPDPVGAGGGAAGAAGSGAAGAGAGAAGAAGAGAAGSASDATGQPVKSGGGA
jgi:hypothetical protein